MCHFTPDQVYDMRWGHLVKLTLRADDRQAEAETQESLARPINPALTLRAR